MTAIELEFLAKDHFIDALAVEEMRRYVTLGRTKTLDEAIKLALEYEAKTKVKEFRKRRAVHTISTQDELTEIKAIEITKEGKVCEIPKVEVASLDNGLGDMIKELKQVITDMKADTEYTPKTVQQLKNNRFPNRRFYNNRTNRGQTRRGVYWNCQSPGRCSRNCPQGNEQRYSRQGQTVSAPVRP